MKEKTFEDFLQALSADGADGAIEMLRQQFASQGDYYRLFEVLKMRCRHRLGLPLMESSGGGTGTPSPELESCLLSACKEIGILLFRDGRPDEGWRYLQPVGDRKLAKQLLLEVAVTDANRDLIVELGWGQNIAPAYAFEIILQSYGTCDAITAVDVQVAQGGLAADDLTAVSEILIQSFYDEVMARVVEGGRLQSDDFDTRLNLGQMLDRYPWLVHQTGHHMDATHLNSIVKIARNVRTEKHFAMALGLSRYGQRLSEDFQYPGAPPFESTYQDHACYFAALLGQDAESAIAHFYQKLERCGWDDEDPQAGRAPLGDGNDGAERTLTAEHLVALLDRTGRKDEALDLHLSHLSGNQSWGVAPSVWEIADSNSRKQRLRQHFQNTGDLLGFAVCQLQQSGKE